MKIWLDALLNLCYPRLCASCDSLLHSGDSELCVSCYDHLPLFELINSPKNAVCKTFWGRVPLVHGSALLQMSKRNKASRLIHQLKYKKNRALGIELGALYAKRLHVNYRHDMDAIIPVPLHKKKEQLRGYNQAELIAQGMAEVLKIPVLKHQLVRTQFTLSQTAMDRKERWNNMQGVFKLVHGDNIRGKHLLLVDDVITTGATLEACASLLLEEADVKMSVGALAYAP